MIALNELEIKNKLYIYVGNKIDDKHLIKNSIKFVYHCAQLSISNNLLSFKSQQINKLTYR